VRLECVEAFAEASVSVLAATLGDEFGCGAPRLARTEQRADGVTVHVRFSGGVQGLVALSVDEPTALRLLARATGEAHERLPALGVDYFLELANVIAGTALCRLHELGLDVVVRPPHVPAPGGSPAGEIEEAEACQIPVYSPNGGILVQVVLGTA
jgi:CheY-specific phosphatase CheX